ncbi:MAG TPA: aldolase [Aldersonia sp.]
MSLPIPSRVPQHVVSRIGEVLAAVDAGLAERYPGERAETQPAHTVYVSAADAGPDTPGRWGAEALDLMGRHSPLFDELDTEGVLGIVARTLESRPVQDLRLDFEDGYGTRSDHDEDLHASRAGATLATLHDTANGPDWCGIRIKGLTSAEFPRALRTLEHVLDGAGGVPEGFVFTVPKLRVVEQVDAAVLLCEALEAGHGLSSGALRFELQIESPQAIVGADGTATVAKAIHRADGRCSGLHYGTYDYGAACGIAAQHQSLEHPAADHAKAVMLAAAAQTGVWVCDGSTQVMPVGDLHTVAAAVRRHHRLVSRSLARGFYQGWDMHPGHLVTRWLATFGFYRTALVAAAPRIQRYLDRQGGTVVDEPATAQALATVVLRGLAAGAFVEADVTAIAPGATETVLQQLRTREETSE